MKKETEECVIISVSHAGLLFGNWSEKIEDLKGKTIVVMNTKRGNIVGAFKFVDVPHPVKQECPICGGKGKLIIKNVRHC